MSTITREFTKEQLIEKLQHRIAVAAKYPDLEEAQLDAAIFKIALASLEAEPVAWVIEGGNHDTPRHISTKKEYAEAYPDRVVTPLYTAPPAPVSVPDEREAFNTWNNDTDCPLAGRDAKTAAWLAWCRRAAMLQGDK